MTNSRHRASLRLHKTHIDRMDHHAETIDDILKRLKTTEDVIYLLNTKLEHQEQHIKKLLNT